MILTSARPRCAWYFATSSRKVLNSQTGEEDKPRLDFISMRPLPEEAEKKIVSNLRSAISSSDAILVADQAETAAGGVVTPAVRDCRIELAAKHPEKAESGVTHIIGPGA